MAQPLQMQAMDTREAFLAEQCSKDLAGNTTMDIPTAVPTPLLTNGFQNWTSPNVVLNVNGEDGQISICTGKKLGILSAIFFVMEKYKLELVSAHIASSDCFRTMYMIHARVSSLPITFCFKFIMFYLVLYMIITLSINIYVFVVCICAC